MATAKSLLARVPGILETAIIANLLGGLVFGLLARLAMTVISLAGGRSNEFPPLTVTLAGTITIVTLPMLFGLPLALLLVAFWRYLPGSGWAKAISAGVVTLVFPGLLQLTSSSFNINNATRYVGLALFVPLLFGYGFLVGGVIHYLNNRSATATGLNSDQWRRWRKFILPAALVILALIYNWADTTTFGR